MRYAEVLLNIPLATSFTYAVDEESYCEIGCRAEVNFRGRKSVGFVVALSETAPDGDFSIKSITRVLDEEPLFGEEEIRLARWIAKRYFSSPGETLALMLPGGKRESTLASSLPDEDVPLTDVRLSAEQQQAIDGILGQEDGSSYLYGITGSGKTEVYLRVAADLLAAGKGVIYLVPEISLTHQIVAEARRRFGDTVSVWHSRITPSQKLTEWRRIKKGEARFVIGARSAVFAPLRDLGLIIIDEEHEGSYKSGSSPRYHARQVAQYRIADTDARLVMGSATPSVEARQLMEDGRLREYRLTQRLAGGAEPEIRIVEMRGEQGILSGELQRALMACLQDKRQAILFLNRRGFSYFFHCRSCGYEMRCSHCSVSLTYHKQRNVMLCHYCGYQERPVEVCPECGSLDVGYSGYGTEGIEGEITRLFPEARIARVDTDSVQKKGSLEKILTRFRKREIDLLLGTQMVAKGLNFPGVRLVGIVMADTTLMLPDFRAAERTFSLLTQVAGRAGRFHPDGEVVIQTYHPEAPAIRLAAEGKQEEFYRTELAVRRMLKFPPFARIVRILFRGKDKAKVIQAADQLSRYIERDLPAGIELLGPAEAPIALIAGNYRTHLMLRGGNFSALHRLLSHFLEQIPSPSGIYREIDADPVSLL